MATFVAGDDEAGLAAEGALVPLSRNTFFVRALGFTGGTRVGGG